MQKKIYKGVDVFKVIAAIGVVGIHANFPILKTLGRLGVPFFVVVSSFFFFNHYVNVINKKLYIKKFLKRILLLFLCWEVFYAPLAYQRMIIFFKDASVNVNSVISYIVKWIFFPLPTNVTGWGPSWYLIALIWGIFFFVMFELKILKGNIFLMASFAGMIELYYVLGNGYSFITKFHSYGTNSFIRILPYIFVGYILVRYNEKIKKFSFRKISILLVFCIFVFLIENLLLKICGGISTSEEVLSTLPTSSILVVFSMKFDPHIPLKDDVILRNFSTFLYCFQAWPFAIIESNTNLHSSIIIFSIVMVISILVFIIYESVKKRSNLKLLNYMV